MSILADKVQRMIKEEDDKMRSLYKVKIESLKNEVARLEAICQKNNIGYKKPAKKLPARRLRPQEYFDKSVYNYEGDTTWTIKYKQNLIQADTRDKCYDKFLVEWYQYN